MVFFNYFPNPDFVPHIYHPINKYLAFEPNLTLLLASAYNLYYIILQPIGGVRLPFAIEVLSSDITDRPRHHFAFDPA